MLATPHGSPVTASSQLAPDNSTLVSDAPGDLRGGPALATCAPRTLADPRPLNQHWPGSPVPWAGPSFHASAAELCAGSPGGTH